MLNRLLNASAGFQAGTARGLVISVAALFGWAVVGLVSGVADQRAALVETRERAGRLSQLANMDLSRFDPGVITIDDGAGLFMDAPSVVIARANLQERISAVAGANNTVVASAGNLPDLKEGNSTLIGLRVDFSGAYEM